MKLISLNTWGARAGREDLLKFFKENSEVDIFCLQEIWNGGEHLIPYGPGGFDNSNAEPWLLQHIKDSLPHHTMFFRPHYEDFFGLLLCIKTTIPVQAEGEVYVYKEKGYTHIDHLADFGRNIQYATLDTPLGARTIINFHGLWSPDGNEKTDSPDRLLQSDNIVSFLKTLPEPYLIIGDFNLRPDTQSLRKLEDIGLRNLVKEYGVTSTRTRHYPKEQRFADYALVSPDIKVTDFKILPDEVSDHSPLYLEFE